MDLALSSEEEQIIDAASAYLSESLPVKRLHTEECDEFELSSRRRVANLGWYGLTIDSSQGGSGFTVVEQMLLFREVGRFLGPLELLPIALAANIATLDSNANVLRDILDGGMGVALEVPDTSDFDRAPDQQTRLFAVRGANCALSVNGDEAFLIDLANVTIKQIPCWDKSISMGVTDLSLAPRIARTTDPVIRRTAQLLSAAMLVGISEAVCTMIVAYAKIRQTFGRPIGAYQAVRHPCAEMTSRSEAARCQLFAAAVALRDQMEDVDLQIDAAKILANQAALKNVDTNIQLHGGIGLSDEHDAHLYLKRARVLSRLFGIDSQLLDRTLSVPDEF